MLDLVHAVCLVGFLYICIYVCMFMFKSIVSTLVLFTYGSVTQNCTVFVMINSCHILIVTAAVIIIIVVWIDDACPIKNQILNSVVIHDMALQARK